MTKTTLDDTLRYQNIKKISSSAPPPSFVLF
jgi:hypothetical protein